MVRDSKIEWTHHTFNPWIGCQKVGPGCDHCYAEAMMDTRLGRVDWGPHASRSRTSASYWSKPLQWDREAAAAGERRRVFCASLADVFDNHGSITSGWRGDLWHLIARTPHLDWLLLTKRPGNIMSMLPDGYGAPAWGNGWPNVWLGCTVVNQDEADRDLPKLGAIPARVRFTSIEPMLGPVDLTALPYGNVIGNAPTYQDMLRGKLWMPAGTVDWPIDPRRTVGDRTYVDLRGSINLVIVGGESGPGARPMHPDWARALRDQCTSAGVPFFFKQWGTYLPEDEKDAHGFFWVGGSNPGETIGWPDGSASIRVGKKAAGRTLEGRLWDQMPEPKTEAAA